MDLDPLQTLENLSTKYLLQFGAYINEYSFVCSKLYIEYST